MIRLVSSIIVLTIGAALGPPIAAAQAPLRVAAASDLKFVFDEAMPLATARCGALRIEPTYGSSGNFHAQLRQRAPFDMFLSADEAYPKDLVTRGIGSAGDLFTYARGRLVLWVRSQSPLAIEREGVRALRQARRLAIANPRHAPYGRAAEAVMKAAGIWADVQPRLVLGENIAQAAQFVQSGAADAGIIARSLALAPAMRGSGRSVDVPASQHAPLIQAGLILPWTRSRDGAMCVQRFLLSPDGRRLLAAYGFDLPS